MKRWMICWLLAVGGVLTAIADQKIQLNVTEGHPDELITLSVALENTQEITAVEIVLPLDKSLQYVEGSASLVKSRVQDHVLSAYAVEGELRLYVYSMGLKPLLGHSGDLLNFKLKLGLKPGAYVLRPRIVLSDVKGKEIPAEVFAGQVTLLAPELTIDTPVIDFGRVPVRADYTQTLTLRNSGTETLKISDIVTDAPEVKVDTPVYEIAPDSTQSVTLTYSPVKRGNWKSEVVVMSDAANGNQKATLQADPFSKNELYVDRVEGRNGEEAEVILRMSNQEPIVGMQCEFELPKEVAYVENSFCSAKRAAQHHAQGIVSANKLTLFMYSDNNVAMQGEEGEIGRFKVRLNGHRNGSTRLEPQNVVLSNKEAENMTSAAYGNDVIIQGPSFSGTSEVYMGRGMLTDSLVAQYHVRNNGQLPLHIEKVTFLAEGFGLRTVLPLVVQPGATADLLFAYRGEQAGDFSTVMNLYTNDSEEKMHAVNVSGSLYEPNELEMMGENLENGDYQWTVALNNYTEIVAVQLDLHWLQGMTTDIDHFVKSERLKGHQVTVAKIGEQDYRIIIYSMSNEVIPGNKGTLFTLCYHPDKDVCYRDTPLQVDNIILSNAAGKNYASSVTLHQDAVFNHFTVDFVVEEEIISSLFLKVGDPIVLPQAPVRENFVFSGWENVPAVMPAAPQRYYGHFIKKGDLNDDKIVDVTDITALVNIILNIQPVVTAQEKALADVNGDGVIDITDISGVVNIILHH